MKKSNMVRTMCVATAMLAMQQAARAALVFEANGADYNPGTGLFTDNVGGITGGTEGAITATDTTPSGAVALTFNGTSSIDLNAFSPGVSTPNDAVTFFAVIRPTGTGVGTIVGGADAEPGCIQYRLNNLQQEILDRGRFDEGTSAGTVPTTGFSVVEVVFNQTTATSTFYLNGVQDSASGGAHDVTRGFTRIGAGQEVNGSGSAGGSAEFFTGDIADIQQYNTALSPADSAAVYSQLVATYLTPAAVPEPASLGLLAAGAAALAGRRRRAI